MKKTLITAWLATSCLTLCQAQNADSLTGPKVWLKADLSTMSSTTWTDLSFFGHHATGASAATVPSTYSRINFNKALVFDGIDDYLKIPFSIEPSPELSILAVFQSADTTERGIWGAEQSPSRAALLTTRQAIGPDTISDGYGKFEKRVVLNTVVQNWENTTASASSGFMALGSAGQTRPFKSFQGSLAELIVFDRALSFLERVQYETYLALKYGTGLNGGNFVSSQEKVLWRVSENAGYGKNIAGIGRDDFFKLNQKQSGSAYDSSLLVISAGPIATNNETNTSAFADQDFIIWGDNGLARITHVGTGEDSLLAVLDRKWLVTVNGNTAPSISTHLYIDQQKLPAESLGYWLVIDRSGTGNFSIDNLEYISPDRVADGKVIYKDVRWDVDGSGKDNFTFARAKDLFAVVRKVDDPLCTNLAAGKVEIEVIKGDAPFQYTLANEDGTISRSWTENAAVRIQEDLTPGAYTLTLQDGSQETLMRKFSLRVPDHLDIDLGPDQQLDINAPLQLDVTAQVPDTMDVKYRWENSFGFSSTEERITVTESGIYRVYVYRPSDGCTFSDDIAITGAEQQRISVYPTIIQSNDAFNVGVSLEKAASVGVKVFNARGIMMETMEGKNQSEYQFITTVKDPGVYMIVIQTPQGVETRKVIAY
jgi:hypothetical protein